MKLSAILLAVAAAQDGDDRWSFYDYSIPNDGRVGHSVGGTTGGHEGNKRWCHSTVDTVHIHRWDNSVNGYFANYNPVECVGEELFCHIEERAHFGQVIGIRAGCAQMMNHPQVGTAPPIVATELKNRYNQEAARGASFSNGGATIEIFYGIGGCLALPAQNGVDNISANFRTNMELNYFMGTHGGYGQNQCLRFQSTNAQTALLPFGVSVCRACCIATEAVYTVAADGPCNFWPYGDSGVPDVDASTFLCQQAGETSCTLDYSGFPTIANNCDICAMEMYPNFGMHAAPDYQTSSNLFETGGTPFCDGTDCTPAEAYLGMQQIVG